MLMGVREKSEAPSAEIMFPVSFKGAFFLHIKKDMLAHKLSITKHANKHSWFKLISVPTLLERVAWWQLPKSAEPKMAVYLQGIPAIKYQSSVQLVASSR